MCDTVKLTEDSVEQLGRRTARGAFTNAVNYLADAIEYLEGTREYEDGQPHGPNPHAALEALAMAERAITLDEEPEPKLYFQTPR